MPRKKKSSLFEDIVELTALLPWWLGVSLAIVSYFVLHSMAAAQVVMTTDSPQHVGQIITGTLMKTLASIGQYLLPFLCLIGAVVSLWRRRTRTKLVDDVIAGAGSSALQNMSWQAFEKVVGEAFRLQGYSVRENGGGGADGGIDLVLKKDGEEFLVQCKQWRAQKVGVTVIRELYGVMAASGAAGGFVVTCGRYTEEARTFAEGRNITLLDGGELERMIRQTPRGSEPASTSASPLPEVADVAPGCPACGKAMLLRTAQRGAHAGKKFWGCSAYPACKGTAALT
jgi:restriction system protein